MRPIWEKVLTNMLPLLECDFLTNPKHEMILWQDTFPDQGRPCGRARSTTAQGPQFPRAPSAQVGTLQIHRSIA